MLRQTQMVLVQSFPFLLKTLAKYFRAQCWNKQVFCGTFSLTFLSQINFSLFHLKPSLQCTPSTKWHLPCLRCHFHWCSLGNAKGQRGVNQITPWDYESLVSLEEMKSTRGPCSNCLSKGNWGCQLLRCSFCDKSRIWVVHATAVRQREEELWDLPKKWFLSLCIEVIYLRATHQLAVPLFVPPFALPALDRWLVPFV